MTEKDKALLLLVGKLLKEKLDEAKEDFSKTIKEMTSQYQEKLTATETFYKEQLEAMRNNYGIETKSIRDEISDIELTPGKDGRSVELEDVVKAFKEDEGWAESLKGDKGEPGESIKGDKGEPGESIKGEDGKSVELEDVVKSLTENEDFTASLKGEPGESIKGEDGVSVDLEDVVKALKEEEDFILTLKGDKGEAGESIKGDKGDKGEPGESIKGEDGTSVELEDVVKAFKEDEDFTTTLKGEPGDSVKGDKGDSAYDVWLSIGDNMSYENPKDAFEDHIKGKDGKDGVDGKFTKAVDYAAEPIDAFTLVVYKGALWQNLMADNESIPALENKSYQRLIAKPEDGKSIVPKGLYKANEIYEENDVVMFNNASWIKNTNSSQVLPGEGWFLLAKAIKGAKGDPGESIKGDKGEPGEHTDITKDVEERVHKLEAKGIIDESNNQ